MFQFNNPAPRNAVVPVPGMVANPVPATAPAQTPATMGVPGDLIGLATVEISETGRPRLPHGEYTVVIDAVKRPVTRNHGQPFVAEYTVLESDNGTPEGRQASYFRELSGDSIAYLAQWLCQVLGAQNKEQRDQVQRLLPFIVNAEVTGQPTPVIDVLTRQPTGDVLQPGMITGHKYHVSIQPGTKPARSGKVYDNETWIRLE